MKVVWLKVLKSILDNGNHQKSHYAQMIEAVAQQLDHQLDQQLNKETGTDLYQFSDSVATIMELV